MPSTLLFFLISFLYIKFLLLVFVYPWQALAYLFFQKSSNRLFLLLSLPYRVLLHITISGWDKFSAVNYGKVPSKHLRKWIYRGLGTACGKNVVFRYHCEIWNPYKLKIGNGSIIGYNCLLDARNGIRIGNDVNFSANVSIYTVQHNHRDPFFACNQLGNMEVVIDDYVWIGPNVIILPGVHIGKGAVCAAGCVVTQDVQPFSVVAGIPAKKVNDRPKDLQYHFSGKESRIY